MIWIWYLLRYLNYKISNRVAGFSNDDLLNFCYLLQIERYKKVEISNQSEEIPDPQSKKNTLKSSKKKASQGSITP
jgi:hypothetical protein